MDDTLEEAEREQKALVMKCGAERAETRGWPSANSSGSCRRVHYGILSRGSTLLVFIYALGRCRCEVTVVAET